MITRNLHQLTANTIRFLAVDAVQRASSGHPGMPMGMADIAVTLWSEFLKHNPADPRWFNRDRFILSGGHGSMLLYSLLHLSGYELPLEELKNFRQWGSLTPGHPESHLTQGVEMTTGPLGQGISSAVGFAAAEQWLAAQFNRPDFPLVDHTTFVFAGDGDLQEGISHEACALAGHWGLGKLIVFYDDNGIQIDGSTQLAFTEDVATRFTAYGWHIQEIDGHDPLAIATAIKAAQDASDRPSLIACKTVIGYGSPNKAGTHSVHGEPLGADEIRLTKEALGWPVQPPFYIPDEANAYLNGRIRGTQAQAEWEALRKRYEQACPHLSQQFSAMIAKGLPADWTNALPQFESGSKLATRAASGKILAEIVPVIPQMLGGSADLTGSNKTDVKGVPAVQKNAWQGRYVHYGVREHGMGAIMNGMALHGGVIPYGGTFLVFSDYMRGSIRLAALMEQQVVYVFTHDSIGLGEDGPTHQPVEHLMALRAIPNLWVMRPADANETAVSWQIALERKDGPTVLALTRQGLPSLAPTVAQQAHKGAYAIGASEDDVAAILATGSEVEIALAAQAELEEMGIKARIVSMPCWELYEEQTPFYQQSVLPDTITNRVSIEAGITRGWQEYLQGGIAIGLDHFGASAPYQTLYREFGLTVENVVTAVMQQL